MQLWAQLRQKELVWLHVLIRGVVCPAAGPQGLFRVRERLNLSSCLFQVLVAVSCVGLGLLCWATCLPGATGVTEVLVSIMCLLQVHVPLGRAWDQH